MALLVQHVQEELTSRASVQHIGLGGKCVSLVARVRSIPSMQTSPPQKVVCSRSACSFFLSRCLLCQMIHCRARHVRCRPCYIVSLGSSEAVVLNHDHAARRCALGENIRRDPGFGDVAWSLSLFVIMFLPPALMTTCCTFS